MPLNRSTDYALQMVVYLAKARKTVSSSKLAAATGVSHRYLLQISAKLRAAGFIRAAHGPSGGLNLDKAPEKISLYDIILSMEGAVRTGEICGTPTAETVQEMTALREEYQKIEKILKQALKAVTLENILQNNQ